MSAIEITLVRHAQSTSNEQGIWQGHGDSPLSQLGKEQVEALSKKLGEESFDIVLSSDLQRTKSTAQAAGVQPELDPQWREIDVGQWDGLTMEQVLKQFPDQLTALQQRKTIAIGGGETWPQVFERANSALDRLVHRLKPCQRAVVFTHGGVIASLLTGALDAHDRWPWPLGRVRNTAISKLRYSDDHIELVTHNDIAHLPMPDPTNDKNVQNSTTVVIATTNHSPYLQRTTAEIFEGNALPQLPTDAHNGQRIGWIATPEEIATFAAEHATGSNAKLRFAPLESEKLASFTCAKEHRVVQHYGTARA